MSTALNIVGDALTGGSFSQKDAAKDARKDIKEGRELSTEALNQAKRDTLGLFGPAFSAIFDSANQARNELAAGTQQPIDILQTATGQANELLSQGSQAFQSALLGQPFNPTTINQQGQVTPQTPEELQRSIQQAARARPGQPPEQQPVAPQLRGAPQRVAGGLGADSTLADFRDLGFTNEQARQFLQAPQQAPVNPLAGVTGTQTLPGVQAPTVTQPQAPGLAPQDFTGIGLGGLESSLNQALQGVGAATTGGIGTLLEGAQTARGDVTGGLNQGLQALTQGVNTGRGDISSALNQALGFQQPFLEGGQTAFQRQLALSGALGQEAFDQATVNNPAQQFIEDRQRQQLLRSAGATGGVGSGALLTALQEQGTGFAQQDLQRQIQNLQQLSGQGQQAAGVSSNLAQGAGNQLANLAFGGGQAQLGAQQRGADTLAQIAQGTAGNIANLGMQGAGTAANILGNIGQARLGVGQAIGGQQANTLAQQAANQLGFGADAAGLIQQLLTNTSNIGLQQGTQQADLLTNLASQLNNLATGQANIATQTAPQLAQSNLNIGQARGQIGAQIGENAAQIAGFIGGFPSFGGGQSNTGVGAIQQQPRIGPF